MKIAKESKRADEGSSVIGFVVNPVSGNGKEEKVWREIEAILIEKQIRYQIRRTKSQGGATEAAVQLLQANEIDLIVAVGGDGTINA